MCNKYLKFKIYVVVYKRKSIPVWDQPCLSFLIGCFSYENWDDVRQSGKEKQMIDWMNSAIMEAFQQVVECIVYGLFPIRRPDYREFRERVEALRQLISPHVSLSRKKRTLKSIQALLPRLLRERYLQRTIRVERRQNLFGPES